MLGTFGVAAIYAWIGFQFVLPNNMEMHFWQHNEFVRKGKAKVLQWGHG